MSVEQHDHRDCRLGDFIIAQPHSLFPPDGPIYLLLRAPYGGRLWTFKREQQIIEIAGEHASRKIWRRTG